MIYIALTIIAAVMAGATLCTVCKIGEKENICNYGRNDK